MERFRSPLGRTVAFCLLIFVVLLLRRPEVVHRPQFWAEDGVIFFQDEMNFGFAKALLTPYVGYLLVVPRLIAASTLWLPVRTIPAVFDLTAILIAAVCCGAFYWPCFRRVIASDTLRAACCLAMATCIPVGDELLGNIANLQWFLSVLMILLIFTLPDSELRRHVLPEVALTISQVLISLTAPATLLCLPFLIWQCFKSSGWTRIRPTATIFALAVELSFIHRFASEKPNLNFNSVFLSTISSGISRAVLAPMIGDHFIAHDPPRSLMVKLVLALMFGAALVTLLLIYLPNHTRRMYFVSAAYLGIGSVAVVMAGRNLAPAFLTMDGIEHTQGGRYFFIAACMFVFIVGLAVDFALSRFRWRSAPLIAPACLLAFFGLGIIRNFVSTQLVDLSWPKHAARIEAWQVSIARHEHPAPLVFPINPQPWKVTLLPVAK